VAVTGAGLRSTSRPSNPLAAPSFVPEERLKPELCEPWAPRPAGVRDFQKALHRRRCAGLPRRELRWVRRRQGSNAVELALWHGRALGPVGRPELSGLLEQLETLGEEALRGPLIGRARDVYPIAMGSLESVPQHRTIRFVEDIATHLDDQIWPDT